MFGQGQGLPDGNTPNYNGAGVMPPKDGGFEQYVAHHLSNRIGVSKDGRINNVLTGGLYEGMSYGEAYDKAREDYAALPDDQKREWESKTFNQNDRRSGEHLYQTPEQSQRAGETDAQGNKIPTWQDIANGRSSGSVQNQQTTFNPGSMGGSGPLANNDTRPHYGIGDASGTNSSNINNGGTRQPDAIPAGQQYTRVGLNSVPNVQQQPSYNVNPSNFASTLSPQGYAQAGQSNGFGGSNASADTAKYGPAMSGTNLQPQMPRYDTAGTLISPNDKLGSNGIISDPRLNATPRFDAGGTLISPGDQLGSNGRVNDPRLVPQVGGQSAGPTGSPSVQPSRTPNYNAAPPAKPLVPPMGASMVVK